jgi:adenylyltransferase/sulfurtransferase
MQAVEAIKLLTASGRPAVGKLVLYDALAAEFREVRVPRDAACTVCSQAA